jgi:small-conductance mechanosensitive channel
MNLPDIKVLQTIASIGVYLVVRIVFYKIIDQTVTNSLLQKTRGKIIKKLFLVLITVIKLLFILTVWGVKQSELLMFMASVLTVIGIALFAQWSHLSNITSGIIIFFSHSIKLDDTVVIIDKDYEVEGRISDISIFFVKLKTKEGEEIFLPNNIFMQKMVKKKITNQKSN